MTRVENGSIRFGMRFPGGVRDKALSGTSLGLDYVAQYPIKTQSVAVATSDGKKTDDGYSYHVDPSAVAII